MIVKELSYYRDYDEESKDIFLDKEMKTLIYNLIKIYLYIDYEIFNQSYLKIDNKSESILNKSFFYLSDSNKECYFNEFVKLCKTNNFIWNESTQNMIISILSYSDFEFDNQTLNALSSKIPLDNIDSLKFDLRLILETSCNEDKRTKCKTFIDSLVNIYKLNMEEEKIMEFNNLIKEKNNYVKLSNYFNEIKQSNESTKRQIIILIERNNYLFPDIKNDMNYDIWNYVHCLSEFIYENGNIDNYKTFLDNEIKCNSTNKSYIDRINAIKKYRLHSLE